MHRKDTQRTSTTDNARGNTPSPTTAKGDSHHLWQQRSGRSTGISEVLSSLQLDHATGPATGTDTFSHYLDSPSACTLPPPSNNLPSTPRQEDNQRLPTLPAQATSNHEQSTFGDFLPNYLQAVNKLVAHVTPTTVLHLFLSGASMQPITTGTSSDHLPTMATPLTARPELHSSQDQSSNQ